MNEIVLITFYVFLMNWKVENVNNFVKNDSFNQSEKQ